MRGKHAASVAVRERTAAQEAIARADSASRDAQAAQTTIDDQRAEIVRLTGLLAGADDRRRSDLAEITRQERELIGAEIAHHRKMLARLLAKVPNSEPLIGSLDDFALLLLVAPQRYGTSRTARRNLRNAASTAAMWREVGKATGDKAGMTVFGSASPLAAKYDAERRALPAPILPERDADLHMLDPTIREGPII